MVSSLPRAAARSLLRAVVVGGLAMVSLVLTLPLGCTPPSPLRDGCTADECGGMPEVCPGGAAYVARCERSMGKCTRIATACP